MTVQVKRMTCTTMIILAKRYTAVVLDHLIGPFQVDTFPVIYNPIDTLV